MNLIDYKMKGRYIMLRMNKKIKSHDEDIEYRNIFNKSVEEFDDPLKQLEYIKENASLKHYSMAASYIEYSLLNKNRNPYYSLKYSYNEVSSLFLGMYDIIRYLQDKLPEEFYCKINDKFEGFINRTTEQILIQNKFNSESEKLFKTLDKMLYCTLSREIRISLTSDEIGNEKTYTLKDYKLSLPQRSLSLVVVRKDDSYTLTLWPIKSINYEVCDNKVKVWTEIEGITWRYYLYMDFNKYEKLTADFESGKYEEKDIFKEIAKFKTTDPLKFHLEHTKYFFAKGAITSEKLINTKLGDEVYLLNAFYDEEGIFDSQHGTIYFINKKGKFGSIEYNIVWPHKEGTPLRLEIVDIPPNGHESQGIGSEAYKMLEEFAKSRGVKEIYGSLSERDLKEHKERTINFYEKHGFRIDGYRINKIL